MRAAPAIPRSLPNTRPRCTARKSCCDGNPKAAICSDCHTTHDIQDPFLDKTQLLITKNCGSCHKEELASYQGTYHGQVNTLGFAYTAKCFDCHGYHTIQRVNDPKSTVYPANRLQTCQKCHLNATPGFVTFEPHATTHNLHEYPRTWIASKFMLLLLGGTFSFFWTHSALWFFREYRDHQQHKDRPHVRAEALKNGDGKPVVYYRRWPAIWRLAHLCFAICTIMLVFTGMTLFNSDTTMGAVHQPSVRRPARHRHRAPLLRRRLPRHLLLAHQLRILAHRRELEDLPLVRPRFDDPEPERPQ